MTDVNVNLSRIAKYAIIMAFTLAIMYFGKNILIPLVISMFIAFLLYPLCHFFERKLARILSIVLTFVIVLLIITGIVYFFGTQFYHLFQNIKNFGEQIHTSIDKVVKFIDDTVLHGRIDLGKIVRNNSYNILGSGRFIENTISASTGIIASFIMIGVFTFLFLLYRTSFKNLILYYFPIEEKENASRILMKIQKVGQRYFFGLFLVILILGSLNGVGLWIIGLDYAFLFGYFAAFLAIIPYIGTFIGGLLPFLYALINHNHPWTAIFVLLWYMFVQALEGNIITPNIVGSNIHLNPLIALIAIFTGALIWGIPGMILFIPGMAVLKVIFDNVDSLKPFGVLLSSEFGSQKSTWLKKIGKKMNVSAEADKMDKNVMSS